MPIGTHVQRAALVVAVLGCGKGPAATPPAPAQAGAAARIPTPLDSSTQMVLVVTPAWDSTSGSLRRFERATPTGAWRQVGDVEPIVVGRTGVAWDDRGVRAASGEPVKREGDGRSPAGVFALDSAFGFDSRQVNSWVRLPYVRLRATTECVDDARSAHYNTIVDRDSVERVDWTSPRTCGRSISTRTACTSRTMRRRPRCVARASSCTCGRGRGR